MREIKFRAYYKADKRIYEVLYLDFASNELRLWDEETEIDFECSFEDVELMQYVGLQDKNGVEIYEGYITKDTYGTQIPMVVTWDDAGFRRFGEHNGERYVGYVKDSCEVIGNIYENPELLGRKNEK